MKKTLMVLSFALCASFAFAQTNSTVMDRSQVNRAAERATVVNDASYSGSIFAKDGELFTCEFNAEPGTTGALYNVGVVGANQQVGGTIIAQHTQQSYHSSWHRIPDTTQSTYNALIQAGNYGATLGADPYTYANWCSFVRGASSANNGYMFMSMQDQIAGWGGTGYTGNFDAYIAFDAFSTIDASLVYARFFQYYRCFNNDQCWMDYSTDGNTWNTVEYNVKFVDVAVNSSLRGFKKVALPQSVGNQANVYLRIRWSCDNNSGGAYGYMFMVDDFNVYPSPENAWTIKSNMYYEGFYQLLPQGLQVPVSWNTSFVNDGAQDQTNVTGTVYAMADGQPATAVVSKNLGTITSNPSRTDTLSIDPMGIFGSNGWGYSPLAATGTYAALPTTTLGLNHFFADLTSTNMEHTYPTASATFDTMAYTVNYGTRNGNACGVWGRDHGTVSKFSYWLAGMIGESTFSTTPDEIMWSDAGYGVLVNYAVGNEIPAGWKILGVEMVPSTYEGYRQSGAKLDALLYKQTNYDSADDNYRSLEVVTTGASTYTVQNSDLISGADFADLEYSTFGNYPTVFIPFPEQPALEAGVQYRVGYQLAEEAQFAVAANSFYYYSSDDSTSVRYANDENTQAFAHSNPLDNRFQVMVIDPYDGEAHYFSMDEWPMIRLVVGPGYYVPKYAFTFECNEGGMIYDEAYNELCGTVDSVTDGSTRSFIILPEEGYHLVSLVVDGNTVEPEAVMTVDENGNEVLDYYTYTMTDIHAAHTFALTYAVDIDFVEGVSLKLQPNPATSNVQLSLNGVSGMVNMALIDMSGRVISTSMFNAENGANINVSNLAKGAYFVRITNDKFSKVEKLIVR